MKRYITTLLLPGSDLLLKVQHNAFLENFDGASGYFNAHGPPCRSVNAIKTNYQKNDSIIRNESFLLTITLVNDKLIRHPTFGC